MAKRLYPVYYREVGVRRFSELMAPRLQLIQKLELPKSAIYHFLSTDPGVMGPSENDYLLSKETGPLWVEFVPDLAEKQGAPRRKPSFQVNRIALEYRAKNKRFKLLKDISTVEKNPIATIIENYAHLNDAYIYRKTLTTWYDQWWNNARTMWTHVNDLAERSERNQYLVIRLPETLPKLSSLRQAAETPSRMTLQKFKTNDELLFLDFFRFLGMQREESAMGILTEKALQRLNIIFTDGAFFSMLSMDLMEAWRASLKRPDKDLDKQTLFPYQKRWLMYVTKLWMQNQDEETLQQMEEERLEDNNAGGAGQDDDEYDEYDEATPNEKPTYQDGPHEEDTFDDVIDPTAGSTDEDDDDDDAFDPESQSVRRIPGVDIVAETTEEEEAQLADDVFDLEPTASDADVVDPLAPTGEETHETYIDNIQAAVMEKANQLADAGQLSGVQYKAAVRNAGQINEIPAPDGSDKSLAEFIEVTPEDAEVKKVEVLPDSDVVVDKSMLTSSLAEMDRKYVTDVMQKDIAASVVAVQQAGYPVTGYSVEEVTDVMGTYLVVNIKLAPVGGQPSSFQVLIPKVNEEGIYEVNGVKYRMRKQRVDLPIRKVSPNEVALSTAYGKVFVVRSERVVNNVGRWLSRELTILSRTPDSQLKSLKRGNVFVQTEKTPFWFSTLAQNFVSAQYGEWQLSFDYSHLPEFIDKERFYDHLANLNLAFGKNSAGELLLMDKDSQLWVKSPEEVELRAAGSLPEFLGLDISKMPVEAVDLEFLGNRIPVGVALAYYIGLGPLLTHLGVEHRVVARGTRTNLRPDEYAISFDDEHLILSKDDRLATLLVGGFTEYRHYLNYARGLFDAKDIYFNVVDAAGLKIRHLKELDRMASLFVDPISRKILIDMGEPTTFIKLLFRSAELLLTNWSPRVNERQYQRIKGYDKFSELLYREMINAIRDNDNNPQGNRRPISISPVSVWNQILDDSASILVEETNPMIDVKQAEEVTYSGTGGRSKRSMTRPTRAYDETDVGVISEGTKDSGDVGISAYLAPNANITSVYGMTRDYDPEIDGPASVMSTSALAVPAADRDDPKRLMFVGIQQNQMIAAIGNDVQPWRTGGETVLAQRVSKNFARSAKGDGVISALTKNAVTVTYDDKELGEDVFEIGTIIGKGPGSYYPHDLITDYKVGDVVKNLDVVVFHKYYFKRDWWNPGQVVWRSGVLCLTGILDIPETHEDSSYSFENLTERFVTSVVKTRSIIVDGRLNIRGLIKVGDMVEPRTILATLEEPLATDLSEENPEAVEALRKLSQFNPRADVHGEVIKIDVLYRADIEDMSETMAKVVTDADKARAKRVKELRLKEATNGRITTGNVRIDGDPLGESQVAIRIFMRYENGAGMGDKGTFAAQMKSVTSGVGHGVNKTEDGRTLDALFSGTSIANRIVTSAETVGSTNLYLLYGTEKAVDIYFNEE